MDDDTPETRLDPAKIIRLGTMVDTLLKEVRQMQPDADARERLAHVHTATMQELASVLPDDLRTELEEFSSCCAHNPTPSADELRIAQAQLVGWLQGLLQGFQASAVAQQMAAAQQTQQLAPGQPMAPEGPGEGGGTYL
ncbi:MAG: DUF2587 domain-containing protein [Acidimicrobiales bacterium]|nr:DUF2587 domain-containing protein [Acidimicrobiales bacterium]